MQKDISVIQINLIFKILMVIGVVFLMSIVGQLHNTVLTFTMSEQCHPGFNAQHISGVIKSKPICSVIFKDRVYVLSLR